MHATHDGLAEKLRPLVLTLRIILGSLAAGVFLFAAVALALRAGDGMPARGNGVDFLSMLAMVWTPLAVILSRVVPMLIAGNARAKIAAGTYSSARDGASSPSASSDTDLLMGLYQSNTIIAAAFLEGTAFFNLVAYLLEGNPVSLGLGIGLAMAILWMLPSAHRTANWIELQLRSIGEERALKQARP
ncbi:MAG: hypothetical protein WD845_15605 [Pirellulales bacterium]